MSTIHEYAGALSGVFGAMAFAIGIYFAAFRGKVPPRAPWIVFTAIDAVALAGMFSANAEITQMAVFTAGAFTLMCLAFWKGGASGWTKLDIFCLVAAAVGIALWQLTSDATMAIVIASATAAIGSAPLVVLVWKQPEVENKPMWILFTISCVFGVIAIGDTSSWTIANATTPVTFLVIETVVTTILCWPRRRTTTAVAQ